MKSKFFRLIANTLTLHAFGYVVASLLAGRVAYRDWPEDVSIFYVVYWVISLAAVCVWVFAVGDKNRRP